MIISLFILLFLLLLSFFFSGSETAVTAVSRSILFEKEKQGDKNAKKLNKMKRRSDKLIGTLLLGNNIVNIAITAIATGLLIQLFGEYGVVIATFGVSFVVLVFSEVLPKTIALQHPTSFSLKVASALYFLVKILSPFVVAINWIGAKTMWLLRIQPTAQNTSEQEIKAEIRGAIELQADEQTLSHEKYMLKSVLDLSEITVADIMKHRSELVTLNVNTPTEEIMNFISNSPYSRIPVWSGKRDNIIGVLHVKTLLKTLNYCYQKHITNIDLSQVMTKPWFILESTSLLNQLHAFKIRREHFALVVDEYGSLLGLVTLEDLLEEIVGDIEDESDTLDVGLKIEHQENGAIRLDGCANIRDVNRHLKWNLSDEHAATLAGLIMYEIERIPEVGQTFDIDGYTFTIIQKERNRITLVDVLPPSQSDPENAL